MPVVRNRLVFGMTVAALAVLLYFFSDPFLLWMLLLMAVFAIASFFLLKRDAKRISVNLSGDYGGREGEPLQIRLGVSFSGKMLVAKYAEVEVELYSSMFDRTEKHLFVIPVKKDSETHAEIIPGICGEVKIRCSSAKVRDIFEIFSRTVSPFNEKRVVLFPHETDTELSLTEATTGSARAEEQVINRQGTDMSETFDIREYVKGDDIRSINWKLSSKTDSLLVRQGSDPSQYDVLLLPDFGEKKTDGEITVDEFNAAASVTVSIGEKLLERGTVFCFAFPTSGGLSLFEVRDRRSFLRFVSEWMCIRIMPQSGVGLQLFRSERLERYFTRLIIVSAGEYSAALMGLEKKIGVTVVSSTDTPEVVYTTLGDGSEAVSVPSKSGGGGYSAHEKYRLKF